MLRIDLSVLLTVGGMPGGVEIGSRFFLGARVLLLKAGESGTLRIPKNDYEVSQAVKGKIE